MACLQEGNVHCTATVPCKATRPVAFALMIQEEDQCPTNQTSPTHGHLPTTHPHGFGNL